MTLTLTRLLEIDAKLLLPEDEHGLQFARLLWKENGCPSEPAALCRTLERILSVCQREGIRYPAILLRRKKELQRGTWKPPAAPAAGADGPGDPDCKLCGGAGAIYNPGGLSGRFCDCAIRKSIERRAKLAAAAADRSAGTQPAEESGREVVGHFEK